MSDIVPTPPSSLPVDPWLVQFGDVSVSRHWVGSPAGNHPLAGTTFTVTDLSRVESQTPTWAVVAAIVGFFFVFLFSLFFLLVKENRVTGQLNVTVQNGTYFHVTQVPVVGPGAIADLHARVNYARQLTAAA